MTRLIFWLFTAIAVQGLTACAHQDATDSSAASTQNAKAAAQSAVASADALTAYHWQLQSTAHADTQPIQLTFSDQRVSVQGLCNAIGAGYTVDRSKMTVQHVVGTMRMCNDPALMQYEQEVGARLQKVASWDIAELSPQLNPRHAQQNPVLTLHFDDGSQWMLSGKATNETKYGSTGETIFLEIEPELAACNHPLIPNKQCLKVRTVEYDAAGLKRRHGAWQNFYGEIEGYTHVPGVRNILRVKRYTRANPPADASRYVYVLDMTVESEKMP